MANDFSQTRIHELLDTYAPADGSLENNPNGAIVLSAGLAVGLRLALTQVLGNHILSPQCSDLRKMVDALIEHNMCLCCKTEDDVKLYTATYKAVIADARDCVDGK